MEFLIYNQIKNDLIKKYNILNSTKNVMRGGLDYKKLPSLDPLEETLDHLKDFEGYNDLQNKLETYKNKIKNIISKIDEILPKAENMSKQMDPDNNISNLFNSDKFKEIINGYTEKIKNASWTGERLNNELYSTDDPSSFDDKELQKEDLFIKTTNDDDFNKFNEYLLSLFGPFINNYDELKAKTLTEQKTGLNTNLDQEKDKLEELIKVANEFKLYIDEKKNNIEKILKTSYNSEDIEFIDNSNNKIDPKTFIQELKEAVVEEKAKLDLKSIWEIQTIIKNTMNGFEIKNEINDLKYFNILDKEDDFNKILNIDDAVKIVTTQSGGKSKGNLKGKLKGNLKGGNFDTNYITNYETNVKILTLLKLYEKLYDMIEKVLDDSQYLKEIQYRFNFYMSYLFLVMRQSGSKDTLLVYKYLPKNKVTLYIDILNKIKSKFSTLSETGDKNTKILNKYHYLIIDKVLNVLTFIHSKYPSDNHIIEIEKCKGYVLNDLTIFNHFKSIIINYVNTSEGQNVTGLKNADEL